MADIIMDGRLDLGIARGAYSPEYERIMPGLDARAGGRMRELIPASGMPSNGIVSEVAPAVNAAFLLARTW